MLFRFTQAVGKTLWKTKNIVCADMIILAKCGKMMDWQGVDAKLVARIIRLCCVEQGSDFCLGFIVVNAKIFDNFIIFHCVSPSILLFVLNISYME